jgi:processive 1,2-diacylglycerol beta-glucosyltransferase
VDRIERWMAAADVVVTKPGGLTASEALAVRRPLLLTRPIPGHEEGNLQALVASGAALGAAEPGALAAELSRVLGDRALAESLCAAARRVGRPDAASRIARTIARRALGFGVDAGPPPLSYDLQSVAAG